MRSPRPIRAVLWDADGVLQEVPGGWRALLTESIGPEQTTALLTDVWPSAQQAMRGEGDLVAELARILTEHGLTGSADRVREVWGTFDRFEDSRALVTEVRALGVGCHLATNQDQLRASYMRERLGYETLMDSCFYSCDLGAAKPEPAFFTTIAAELGLEVDELAFVDDLGENIATARDLGLHAIHWHHRDGVAVLRERLASLGIGLD